jgi:hypothetical protein
MRSGIDFLSITRERLGIPDTEQPICLAFGGGVNSMALLIALKHAGIIPDFVTFADTGHEKKATYAAVARADKWLRSWANIGITTVRYRPKDETGYTDLGGGMNKTESIPSVSFPGRANSCSTKWKKVPQDYAWKGCRPGHPNSQEPHPLYLWCEERGIKAIKLIGYDAGKADIKRAGNSRKIQESKLFENIYPLQNLGWDRAACEAVILAEGLEVPPKSSCTFCGAMKLWEIWELAATEPEALSYALRMEYVALTGKNSRWQDVQFGRAWEDYVATGDRFPSKETSCGLGIKFSWCQWATVAGVSSLAEDWEVRPLSVVPGFMDAPGDKDNSVNADADQLELF